MIELMKELVKRNWCFEYNEGTFYMILGNEEKCCKTDAEALELLDEINTYWSVN